MYYLHRAVILLFAILIGIPTLVSSQNPSINLTTFPKYRQLFPRDLGTNMGQAEVAGTVNITSGYSDLRLYTYRNEELIETQSLALSYDNGLASFQFTTNITAELANYRVRLAGVANDFEVTISSAEELVAGEVFIINGQSNAIAGAGMHPEDYDLYARSFTYANDWELMNRSFPGLWGGHLAKKMITELGMPVAIFNQAVGGQRVDFFLKNDASPSDGNYGALMQRLESAGVADRIRAILWYQGESDGWETTLEEYKTHFADLYNDWMQDFSWPKVYLFQVRYRMCGHPSPSVMEAQRQLSEELDNLEIMSTTKATTDNDVLCHFEYIGGHDKLGAQLYRLIAAQLYGQTSFDVYPPAVSKITYAQDDVLAIELDHVDGDLQIEGFPWSDFKVEGSNVFVEDGWVEDNKVFLQLSAVPNQTTGVSYLGHPNNELRWITNSKDVGLLTFLNYPICSNCSTPDPKADLDIQFTATKSTELEQGDQIRLLVTVNNNGPDVAEGIVVQAQLPNILNANTTNQSFVNGLNTWSIGSLASGGSTTLELNCTLSAFQSAFSASVEIIGSSIDDPDSTPGNFNGSAPNEDDEALLTFFPKSQQQATIDLAIVASTDKTEFKIYDFVTYTIELQNTGSITATHIIVDAPMPDGLAFTESTISAGAYADWDGKWRIPSLAAGASHTLELTLFTLNDEGPIPFYTQVLEADQLDADSSPGNGTATAVVEDDEALVTITPGNGGGGGGDTEVPLATLSTASTNVSNAFEVSLTFSEAVEGFELSDLLVRNGWVTNKQGSGNAYTFLVNPSENGPVEVSLLGGSVNDAAGNENPLSDKLVVIYTAPTNGEFVDLELTLEADKNSFKVYDFVTFELSIQNKGTIASNNILIDFPFPDDFVFTEKDETHGDYNDWLQEWAIPSLEAGETATLLLTLFSLKDDGQRIAFAQVMESAPVDYDATPDNDIDQIADEDDEARLVISPIVSAIQRTQLQEAAPTVTTAIQLFPNPVQDRLSITFEAANAGQAMLSIWDSTGKLLQSNLSQSAKGFNQVQVPVHTLAKGLYFIRIQQNDSHNQVLPFVKN